MSRGPNDTVGCPSESHRRHEQAHGRICLTCEPSVEWSTSCPICLDRTTVYGTTVFPHLIEGEGMPCPGGGMTVPFGQPRARRSLVGAA